MLVQLASVPGSADRPNEDFVAASANAVVLLDGAGAPAGTRTGCVHGVAWYTRTLACALLAEIDPEDSGPLTDGLAAAIDRVRAWHADTCDLEHAGSPSATVVAVRWRAGECEYLVLADSVLVFDRADRALEVITDDRLAQVGRELRRPMDALATGTPEHDAAYRCYVEALATRRNATGGYWVASTDPKAAQYALTGAVPLDRINAVVLLSDGASRLVDRFDLATWPQALDMLAEHGPDELIARVRAAEDSDPHGERWPRGKAHDDATIAYCLPPYGRST